MRMTRLQLEAWVLSIYDSVKTGVLVEDSRVELKAGWIQEEKAARRIAGHANASMGEQILWIIGIDEKEGVVELDQNEFSNWWASVSSYFNGDAPSVENFVVHTEDGSVMALLMDSSAAPFVVKNPMYGKPGAGSVEYEVPWREGTSIRSARRPDLIRLLSPIQLLPEVEVLSATLQLREEEGREDKYNEGLLDIQKSNHLQWSVYFTVYVAPKSKDPVVFPIHKTVCCLLHRNTLMSKDWAKKWERYGTPSYYVAGGNSHKDSVSVETTSGEAIIYLPGQLKYEVTFFSDTFINVPSEDIKIRFSVEPVHMSKRLQFEIGMKKVVCERGEKTRWEYVY